MDKLGKSFRKNLIENYYRLLALTHVTVNKVAIPTADKVSSYIQESVKLPEAEQNSTGLSTKLKRSLSDTILYGDELARKPLNDLAEYLDQSVMEVENKLKEDYNINTNQWMFSVGNLEMFEKIASLATITFKEVQHLGKMNSIRYLSAWNMLQRLYLTSYEKRMESKKGQLDYPHDHEKVKELQAIRDECLHYSIFAHGTYGWLINHIYNGKQEFNQLLKSNRSHLDDFLFHTKLQEAAVFYSFWDTTPYKPAHIIAKDEKKKSIVLSIRGTDHWADAVTDLDFHYLSFSIVKDPNNGKLFLRFNYNEETQGYLKKRLGDDTRELNGEIIQPLTGREEVIETGFAHAGMLVSAIGAYKEITPKLEEILSRPEHSEYNLVVTGHSLGGGITTLMSLLYLIHPLPVFKDQAKEKLKGFSYGSASVLSTDFDKYLRDTLTTVVLGYDVVPRLSYGSVKDLCKVMLAFDEINSKDPSAFAEVMNMDTSGGDFDQLQKESKGRVGKFKSLYENFKHAHMDSLKLLPMGRVFHFQDMTMQPIKRNGRIYDYVMREITEKEYFDEIIFSRQLVKHHFPPLYEDALYSPRVLYQRYLEKAVNKEGSSITHSSEVKSYTK